MKPIRILHVLGCLDRGGAETMLMNLYRHIDKNKIQFDFVVHTIHQGAYDSEIRSMGGRIYALPRYKGLNHFSYKQAWIKFFREHDYKIIHGHIRSTASIYLKLAKRYNLVTIAHSHSVASRGNALERSVKNILQKKITHFTDYFLACSLGAGKWLFGASVIARPSFFILKNVIDSKSYALDESALKLVKSECNLIGKVVIGHVGSFTPPKNHDFLIDIFVELQRSNENAILLLVGEGELKGHIQNKVKNLGLTNSVVFTGERADVPTLLQAMDVFVFPSIFEGLGLAVIEAQATGLPSIVSSKVPNDVKITNLVESVSLKDTPKDWAAKISRCIDYTRESKLKEIKSSGYDITETSLWLGEFYVNMLNE